MSRRVPKPWGHELIWAETDRYVGKILHINAGESLSLQYHQVKAAGAADFFPAQPAHEPT